MKKRVRTRGLHSAPRRRTEAGRSHRGALIGSIGTVAVAIAVTVVLLATSAGPTLAIPPPVGSRTSAVGSTQVVPYQYIAKGYTELLGRAPSGAEWASGVRFFRQHDCTRQSLETYGLELIQSREYRTDYPRPDAAAIALTLFRFVLNREPDPTGFVTVRQALTDGASAASEAAAMYRAVPSSTD